MEEPMRRWPFLFLALVLTACTASVSAEKTGKIGYRDLGPAPELTGNTWINTSAPLRLADLRGKVVLLDMWTFDCINCLNVIPSLREWHKKYAREGLVVIGNHFPEFNYERPLDNLKQAVVDLNVPYPVVQDNEGLNWRAYKNLYWPTLYLIDHQGHIRYINIGEGNYAETETAIQTLLAEPVN
jgi:thiol-disulfide isomerase/thioredoxin